MAVHPIQQFLGVGVLATRISSVWSPVPDGQLPMDLLSKCQAHLSAEGGTGTVSIVFNVKDWRALSARVVVEGARKDLT